MHAAARDEQRPPGAADDLGGALQRGGLGHRAGDVPHPLGEELLGPVVRLGLHVLRQRDRHRAGLGRVGEHPHRAQQGGGQLLGPPHPVEEPRQRAERVVDAHVVAVGLLQLLQHGAGDAGGEDVAGQQQHRDAVDGGQRRAGEHVGGAGADRRGARQGLQAVAHAGVADGGVHHALLVAGEVVGHRRRCRPTSSRAWPTPATLPWPKMPNGRGSGAAPRRRARCTGWPGTSRAPGRPSSRSCVVAPPSDVRRQPGVDLLVRPRCRGPRRAPGRRRSARPARRRARP